MLNAADALFREMRQPWADVGLKVVAAIALVLLGWKLCKWLVDWERRLLARVQVDEILSQFIRNATYTAVLAIVIVTGLELAGVPVASLMTVMGAAALGVGLALKDSLSHIAAGLMLIILRPFHVGDRVTIANQDGLIEGVYIFTTRLRTPDNRSVILMNGAVIGAPITNYSRNGMERIAVTIKIGAGTDPAAAMKAAQEVLAEDARISANPAAEVLVTDMSDSGVVLSIRAWSSDDRTYLVRSDMLRSLYTEFSRRGFKFSQAGT